MLFLRSCRLAIGFGLLSVLIGCTSTAPPEVPQTRSEASTTSYPLTLTDASGTAVTLNKKPERIISIAPSVTEVLFAIGAGQRVVGVDDWSNEPKEAQSVTRVGGMDANIEKIVSLKPDIVFAGWTLSRPTIESLRAANIVVFASEPRSIDETIEHIRTLGRVLDQSAQAQSVISTMEQERSDVRTRVAMLQEEQKKRVYIEFSAGWTVGPGEFMDELLREAGGVNIATTPGWHEINAEAVVKARPDVIVYSTGVEQLENMIRSRPGWQQLPAIQNERLIGIEDNLLSRPGPRITKGLLSLAQGLYPEKW